MSHDSEVIDDYLGEEVVDPRSQTIGTLVCYWEQKRGGPTLLGIDIGMVEGNTHVVPAKSAEFDERKSCVVISFTKERISRAPALECGSEIDREFEKKVYHFYGPTEFDYDPTDDSVPYQDLKRTNHSK
ncbi:MAG: hypothetical protein ABI042_17685 [Verrucomicrobiota bacterium]